MEQKQEILGLAKEFFEIVFSHKEFFTPLHLKELYHLTEQQAIELIEKALQHKIIFQVIDRPNKLKSEYALKQYVINLLENNALQSGDQIIINFTKDAYNLLMQLDSRSNVLDIEQTELREQCLTNIALNKRKLATEALVHYIKNKNYIYTTKDDRMAEVWIYDDGIYRPHGESFIKAFCRKILVETYTVQIVNEVIQKIKADTFIDQDIFFNQENPSQIPIQNGILDIIKKEITPFTPKKIFFNKLPLFFDPSAECPKIKEHFNTILKDEIDQKIMFEIFGYLLLKENKLEKAFMLSGTGRNGKSKTLELMRNFVGPENVSALPLQSMHSESFSLSELFGKLANIAGDLSSTSMKETGTIKNLIGRDTITAKRKFLRDLNFVNYSKLIFACNELPKIYDMSDGFWTKWIILEFPYKFVTEQEKQEIEKESSAKVSNLKIINPDIIQEISTEKELSGLLNEALKALETIIEQKAFSYPKKTKEIQDFWIRQSNSFTAFCYDHIEDRIDARVSKKILRKMFHKYCRIHRLKGAGDVEIKATLQNLFGATDHRETGGDMVWEGIAIKSVPKKEDREQ